MALAQGIDFMNVNRRRTTRFGAVAPSSAARIWFSIGRRARERHQQRGREEREREAGARHASDIIREGERRERGRRHHQRGREEERGGRWQASDIIITAKGSHLIMPDHFSPDSMGEHTQGPAQIVRACVHACTHTWCVCVRARVRVCVGERKQGARAVLTSVHACIQASMPGCMHACICVCVRVCVFVCVLCTRARAKRTRQGELEWSPAIPAVYIDIYILRHHITHANCRIIPTVYSIWPDPPWDTSRLIRAHTGRGIGI